MNTLSPSVDASAHGWPSMVAGEGSWPGTTSSGAMHPFDRHASQALSHIHGSHQHQQPFQASEQLQQKRKADENSDPSAGHRTKLQRSKRSGSQGCSSMDDTLDDDGDDVTFAPDAMQAMEEARNKFMSSQQEFLDQRAWREKLARLTEEGLEKECDRYRMLMAQK